MKLNFAGIFPWILRLIIAIIFLQTLFFKFTGSDESVHIFSQLGMEPWGRIGTGILELIASILVLIPRTTFFGALIAFGLMIGAIGAHLFKLGISVNDDGGQLFIYALLVFTSSVTLLIRTRNEGIRILKK